MQIYVYKYKRLHECMPFSHVSIYAYVCICVYTQLNYMATKMCVEVATLIGGYICTYTFLKHQYVCIYTQLSFTATTMCEEVRNLNGGSSQLPMIYSHFILFFS